jgi:hypothetical protein
MPRAYVIGETKGKRHVIDYNAIQEGASHEATIEAMEFYYAKTIGSALMYVYKNRNWIVDVDIRNQMIVIGAPDLSKVKGYYLPMKRDTLIELCKRAVHAGGEILERYNLSRQMNISADSFEMLPRDFRDEVISSDAAPTCATKKYDA